MQSRAGFDWAVMALLVAIWGSGFAFLKVATEHIDPLWTSAIRTGVATLTLAVALVVKGDRLPPLRHPAWRAYLFLGAVGMAIPLGFFAYASQRTPSAVVAICNGASPIFTGVLAHIFLAGDRLTPSKTLGIAIGFAGLVALVAPRLAAGASVEALALSAALFGSLLYAIANVATRTAPHVSASVGALMMVGWAFVVAIGLAAAFEAPPAWPIPTPSLAAVLVLGAVSTGLSNIGYVFLVQRRGPLFMSMSIYLAPCIATALGMAMLGERPGWPAFVALGLILLGVALATMTPRWPARS
ncbi:MAG: DMT family transporter [Phenylobacterium sp.]|uniref:DMT family transporter n=1 Tax=Phenylobacterium sp. TaxID=1871053 RepID=UPI001A588716|nr:DMT family transporter [Phenylobacterium sp.]MBL8771673.1 DMT family transporter [Phenylobacterium sp.]